MNIGPGSQTGSDIIQRPPPPVNKMTHASENITLLQTSFAGGKYHGRLFIESHCDSISDARKQYMKPTSREEKRFFRSTTEI